MVQKRKIFILDTNVILHDSSCINHFEEHNIILPITVLEELDVVVDWMTVGEHLCLRDLSPDRA